MNDEAPIRRTDTLVRSSINLSDASYLKGKWRTDVTDPKTGVGLDVLKREVREMAEREAASTPWPLVKAHLFRHVCRRMSVGFSKHDFFPAFACYSRTDRPLAPVIQDRIRMVDATLCKEAAATGAEWNARGDCAIRHDYDHAAPDWDTALRLGFPGLRERVYRCGEERTGVSVLRETYHEAFRIAIDTILETLERLERCAASSADAADPRVRAAAEAIHNLRFAPPKTTYEVLMFQLLYFYFGEHVDNLQVRTLGNVDRLWTPYYRADLAAGRLTEAQFREMLAHFWWQWGSIDNYWGQPVYIGGTKEDGTTEYDEVSRLVLDVHDELALPTPKLQLKIAANTPEWVWEKALDMSRRHRSLVYCGEEPMRRAMRTMGFTDEETRTADIWGCYEFQPRATANTTLPVILNAVSPVADLLKRAAEGGFAAPAFEAFRDAYLAELARRTDVVRDLSFEYEKHMDEFIPSLVHSLTIDSCVTAGRNAVGNGMKYNLTVLLLCGMGTAADALLGVKEIVYERRLMSLADLGRLMAANWKGQEALRLERSRSRRKWGNGDAEACQLADVILKTFGGCVNGRPNSRGGRFYAGGHSIDYYRHFGYALGATPDGRQKGDEISKNLSPTPGADREGATALVGDFGRLDIARDVPGDTPCDMWMHPATIHGEAGLVAMKALVRVYHANGGVAIHFNVFSPEELRDAQAHPERYENLQVRVCGWNVRWNDLSRHEQDSFIRRAEAVLQ